MDVAAWLRKLGLGQYEAAFRANEVDGSILAKLTSDDLKELGVAAVGHRRKLLSAIAELSETPEVGWEREISHSPPREAWGDAQRRHIAVLFCDLVNSTDISAHLDAEEWRDLLSSYLAA